MPHRTHAGIQIEELPEAYVQAAKTTADGRGQRALAGLREATRHLRRGGLVAILADVDVTGTGAEVDFLSMRASLPNLPVALALRTQAALVPCVASRVGAGERCTVSFQPALELPRGGDRREALRLGTQLLALALAEGIRAAPGQWFREARWLRRPAADTA